MSPAAQAAWAAYQAMAESKDHYFSFLSELDSKYREGGTPVMAENLRLEQLLAQHNESVSAFTACMAAVTDAQDRTDLLERMQQAIGKN